MKVIVTATITKTTITTAMAAELNLLRPRDFTFEAQLKLNQVQTMGSHSAKAIIARMAAKSIENIDSI